MKINIIIWLYIYDKLPKASSNSKHQFYQNKILVNLKPVILPSIQKLHIQKLTRTGMLTLTKSKRKKNDKEQGCYSLLHDQENFLHKKNYTVLHY